MRNVLRDFTGNSKLAVNQLGTRHSEVSKEMVKRPSKVTVSF